MNSSLVENLDSIRNVVGEITSRIDKINTDYGYDNSLSLNKPSSRISKKKILHIRNISCSMFDYIDILTIIFSTLVCKEERKVY